MNQTILPTIVAVMLSSLTLAQSPIENAKNQWPQAAGPHGTWATETDQSVPTSWSVSNNTNIKWKTALPEGGQSSIAVWGDRLFLTMNNPLPIDTPLAQTAGTDIVGLCLNSNTGEILWTVPIPGTKKMPYSGLFSDNSSPAPVTNGKHVWFTNAGGRISCFDMQGKQAWTRPFESRTRHNAKQCEPILIGNQLLYVLMREPSDPLRREMKATPGKRESGGDLWPWTFVRSFDASTGEPLWTESAGTSIHNTPRIGYINKKPVIFHARGGGHRPPETPYGFSMTSIAGKQAGKTLWNYESKSGVAYAVSHFDENYAYGFDSGSLVKLDAKTGKLVNEFPLFENATIHTWNKKEEKYETHSDASFTVVTGKFKKEPTNQTAVLAGKYFLFLTHEGHCICRVNTETGKTEFLQVPTQVVRKPNKPDQQLWNEHIAIDGTNSRNMPIADDKRSKGDGWGHVTSGSPIVVNQYVFFPTMIGMTYVVDIQAKDFDESALVAINDLGPAGKTWSLSAPSYAQGKIFHRGLKQVVCIGDN
ncbi:MAG: outer membrane protein assembly factor BamB family protein [Pirellulales bacterium]